MEAVEHELTYADDVTSVAFSPDGSRIVTGSYRKEMCIWDVTNGKLLHKFMALHGSRITSLAFSPDGSKIVSGSADRMIAVWDANTWRLLKYVSDSHRDTVNSLAYSPDGRLIISGSSDTTVKIWDADKLTPIQTLRGAHEEEVKSVAFSGDGSRIISGSKDGTLIWEITSVTQQRSFEKAEAYMDTRSEGIPFEDPGVTANIARFITRLDLDAESKYVKDYHRKNAEEQKDERKGGGTRKSRKMRRNYKSRSRSKKYKTV